jgi:hypothetical protein
MTNVAKNNENNPMKKGDHSCRMMSQIPDTTPPSTFISISGTASIVRRPSNAFIGDGNET